MLCAAAKLAAKLKPRFPRSLDGAPCAGCQGPYVVDMGSLPAGVDLAVFTLPAAGVREALDGLIGDRRTRVIIISPVGASLSACWRSLRSFYYGPCSWAA